MFRRKYKQKKLIKKTYKLDSVKLPNFSIFGSKGGSKNSRNLIAKFNPMSKSENGYGKTSKRVTCLKYNWGVALFDTGIPLNKLGVGLWIIGNHLKAYTVS